MRRARGRPAAGFTLIELMVAVAVVGILAAVALPSYARYMVRAHALIALTTLSSVAIGMEQRFQDTGSYGCGAAIPPTAGDFAISCEAGGASAPAGFLIKAIGSGSVSGISYSIDDVGVHRTLAYPGSPSLDCWTIRGGTCDS